MKELIEDLLSQLSDDRLPSYGVIPWASPIVFFGDAMRSRIATVGINPSNREFVDENGRELDGASRRFPTLASLGLQSWRESDDAVIENLVSHCQSYFFNKPYELWFNKLETLISHTACSYYSKTNPACHLDIIPFATASKWMSLGVQQKNSLLSMAGSTLGTALEVTPIELLILNGRAVVDAVSKLLSIELSARYMSELNLPRRSANDVSGIFYEGNLNKIEGRRIDRTIKVIGFNHNIQSSFGVTTDVIRNLSKRIGRFSGERDASF